MMKRILTACMVLVMLFCGVAFAVDRKQLGTSANVSGGKTKIYDVSTQDLEIWRPTMILLSARDSAVFFQVYIDQNVSSLTNNGALTLGKATTGGTIVNSVTVYVRMTAVDSQGLESEPTDGAKRITLDPTTDTNKVTVSWLAVSGAASYNIYASDSAGGEAFVGNTASLTYDVTSLPVSDPVGIPTLPLIAVQIAANTSLPIIVNGMTIAEKIEVYVVASSAARPSINIPVEVEVLP